MASVKISDRLYRDIVRRARKIGEVKYDNIRKNPPKIDMETIYNKLISVSEQSLLNSVPHRYLSRIKKFTLKGFFTLDDTTPKEFENIAFDNVGTNECIKPWYIESRDNDTEVGNANGCTLSTGYSECDIRCDWHDSKWDYLKADYIDWCKKLKEQSDKNNKFVDDIEKIASSFGTIRKMVQAYPEVWHLIPQEDKDRANAPTVKRDTAEQVAEKLDVDKDSLSATIVLDKITKGGDNE